jgi:ribosomal protein S18 acetylase RimI-like enzyme
METPCDLDLWERILRADETYLAYFGESCELPGVSLFTAERPDAPEFDLAVIYRVTPSEADATLRAILCHFRARRRAPRVRLTPVSAPPDWPQRLERAGFVESDERLIYHLIPDSLRLPSNPAVEIRRAVTPAEVEQFSAVQVAGFQVPEAHREWDRALALRHLARGDRIYYLASLDGQLVGAAAMTLLPQGVAALWGGTTLPGARRSGVGTSLIQHRVDEARAAGSTVLFGTAAAGSYAASLQERMGFQRLFATRTFIPPG